MYDEYLKRSQREYGNQFDTSELVSKFAPFLHKREIRLKVQFSHGEVKWGWIGVTTGWRPVFLLMRAYNSIGSSYTLREDDEILEIREKR